MARASMPVFAVLVIFGFGCSGENGSQGVRSEMAGQVALEVFAASSLYDALTEAVDTFEVAWPGLRVHGHFAGSQQLVAQLGHGAYADVLITADGIQMERAVRDSLVRPGDVFLFAANRLCIIAPAGNPSGLRSWQDLGRPGITLIMAAAEVPAGRYSRAFLEKATEAGGNEWARTVLRNIVSHETNARSIRTKVMLGEADAGLAYCSDTAGLTPEEIHTIQIPPALNIAATYPAAVLSHSFYPAEARAFIDFLLSPRGQSLLSRHGFSPVGTSESRADAEK